MRSRVRRLAAREDGFTLAELLVVLAILGIVLAALTALFDGALTAATDQTDRTQAQLDGRLALDKLRREIHCASGVTASTLPMSVTVSIPGYCSSPTSTALAANVTVPPSGAFTVHVSSISGFNLGVAAKNEILIGSLTPIACTGADAASNTFSNCTGGTPDTYPLGTQVGSSVTWCTTATGPQYSLRRYVGGALTASPGATCSGSGGVTVVSSLTNNAVFGYSRSSHVAINPPSSVSGGSLDPGSYYYDVTAVTSTGEVSGTVATCSIGGAPNQTCRITWTPFPGATAYNIYGRDNGSTSPRLSPVAGQNTSSEAPQGLRLIGTVPASTNTFDDTNAVDTAAPGLQQPPLATITVSLVADATTADAKQRFTLNDAILLGNSGRY
jgi:prepilin-type N-terminal cleavage/methylation domain-containing protein